MCAHMRAHACVHFGILSKKKRQHIRLSFRRISCINLFGDNEDFRIYKEFRLDFELGWQAEDGVCQYKCRWEVDLKLGEVLSCWLLFYYSRLK